tara:strand:- start:753 stop:1772 length:1020 start_codon:yes stop_codon:yes gene_type:complete
LINGDLVAFPTETVYGLGGNAFNINAIDNIFKVKERPNSDPLIVHIDKLSRLKEWNLVDISEEEYNLVELLAKKFWPGPLTIIMKSSNKIPDLVTSGTGFVGIRIPNNQDTLKLIELSNIPIVGPSANKFAHVSPTTPSHVEYDFKDQQILTNPVYILNSEKITSPKIGIESTIIKLESINEVNILRLGFITMDNLNDVLGNKVNIYINKMFKKTNDNVSSSGQFIKHYTVNCKTYLVKTNRNIMLEELPIQDNIAVIDIGKKKINEKIDYYDNLSEDNDIRTSLSNYYSKLRNFEIYNSNFKIVVLYIIVDVNIQNKIYDSLVDRIYRTSSGNILNLT